LTLEGRHRHSFVLRIWRTANGLEWKGWVQHANSGESARIDSMADLLAFIERHKEGEYLPAVDEALDDDNPGDSNLK
jgi:hypothetical protein